MQMSNASIRVLGLAVLGAYLLSSCGGTVTAPVPAAQAPLTQQMPKASFYSTFEISANSVASDRSALEARTGGKVLIWSPEGGYAVVGYAKAPALSSLSNGQTVKKNKDSISAGLSLVTAQGSASAWTQGSASAWTQGSASAWTQGSASAWTQGSASAWTQGSASAWTQGSASAWTQGSASAWTQGGVEFALMPPNTAAWMKVKLMQAHQQASNFGSTIKVAILDTGADLTHPMLSPALVDSSDLWDFADNDASPQEIPLERDANNVGILGVGGYGHGSNVAGIVRQMAPAARIMPLRVLGADGSGDPVNVAAAVEWAISKGANVINLSLGTEDVEPVLEAAIAHAVSQGILVVSSTGNTGDNVVTYPSTRAPQSVKRISVSSTSNNDVRSSFATYGSKVEIAAPGEAIYSAAPDSRVAAWSGTSMSSPVVAGVAALVLREMTSTVQKCAVLDAMMSSADPLPNQDLGRGRLNAEAALTLLKSPSFSGPSECS